MESQFRGSYMGSKKDQFMKRLKNEKHIKQKITKNQEHVRKVQSLIRTKLTRIRITKEILHQASEKVDFILEQKCETELTRYNKLMSRAIYHMPYFFQALLFMCPQEFRYHHSYLNRLLLALFSIEQLEAPILAHIFKKRGFQLFQLYKLVNYSITRLGFEATYEEFLNRFLREASHADISSIAKDKILRQCIVIAMKKQVIAPHTRNLIFKQLIIPFEEEILPELSIANVRWLLVLMLDHPLLPNTAMVRLFSRRKITELNFISLDVPNQKRNLYYTKSRLFEHFESVPHDTKLSLITISEINCSLFLHLTAFDINWSAVRQQILQSAFDKVPVETDENFQHIQEKIRMNKQFEVFLNSLPIQKYMDCTLYYFQKCLQSIVEPALEPQLLNSLQLSIKLLSDVFVRILDFFKYSYRSVFQKLYTRSFVGKIWKVLDVMDAKNLPLQLHRRSFVYSLLQLFILSLDKYLAVLDDIDFVRLPSGFSKTQITGIIGLIMRTVHELTFSNSMDSERSVLSKAVSLINSIYAKNYRTQLLDTKVFQGSVLTSQLKNFFFNQNSRKLTTKYLEKVPFALSFEKRLEKFVTYTSQHRTHERNHHHYLSQLTFLFTGILDLTSIHMTVRRGNQFQDAMRDLSERDLRAPLRITFINRFGMKEEGIDGGGLTKQFLNRVMKQLFSPGFGLFVSVSEKGQFIPASSNQNYHRDEQYKLAGALVAKAIYSGILIQPKFCAPFLNLMQGRQNQLEDLQYIDRQIYKNLIDLKRAQASELAAYQFEYKGESLNADNRMDFIMNYADEIVNKQILRQSRMFRKGFNTLINDDCLMIFNHDELNKLISGDNLKFDLQDLKKHVVYSGYSPKDKTIEDLWKVVVEMNKEDAEHFLRFVTACSRAPLLGFRMLQPPFKISRSENTEALPTAHTCMNLFKLPDYQDIKVLKEKLIRAISQESGFYFC